MLDRERGNGVQSQGAEEAKRARTFSMSSGASGSSSSPLGSLNRPLIASTAFRRTYECLQHARDWALNLLLRHKDILINSYKPE